MRILHKTHIGMHKNAFVLREVTDVLIQRIKLIRKSIFIIAKWHKIITIIIRLIKFMYKLLDFKHCLW